MNHRFLLASTIGLFLVAAVIFTHSFKTNPVFSNKIQVTTSFYPLYFFTSEIGKEKTQVINITPAGSEPHDYEPTAQDIAQIERSQMLVLNGGVEAWGDKIKDNLKGTKTDIVVAGEGLLTRQLSENGATAPDPHVWLSPKLAKVEVDKIAQSLEKIDPASTNFYQANADNLKSRLDQLDQEYAQKLKSCQSKDIITSHAAFGYLAAEFNLNQVAIAGISPDAEPSSQQLADVANFAKKNNVQYIFFESLVSPKLSQTIASEVSAKTLVLDPLEGLSDDDLKTGKNYFTVMRENLKNLQTALGCQTQTP